MLSIVIPVYNREHTLPATLASIDAQTRRPERVILVDNNSTDSSLSIITQWAASRPYVTVLSEPKPGASAARNRGLSEVDTEWTMFFDSDDIMLPHHVADFVEAINRHLNYDILGRHAIVEFPDNRRKWGYFMSGFSPMFWHLWRGTLATQRYIARTELFRRVGGWNESIMGWNDFELGVRLLSEKPRICKLSGSPSVRVLFQEVSITGARRSDHPERWEHSLATIRKHVADLPASHSSRNRWLAWVDARTAILAATYRREASTVDDADDRARREALGDALYSKVISVTDYPRSVTLIYRHFPSIAHVTRRMLRLLRRIF